MSETAPIDASTSAGTAAAVAQLWSRGLDLHQAGQLAQAQASYLEILRLNPEHADALHLLGVIAGQTNNHRRAVDLIGKAAAIAPDNAAFRSNLGNSLLALGQLDAAIASYDQATALDPGYADAHFNRGVALQAKGQAEAAVASYDRAIALRPDYASAYCNRGNALRNLKRPEAALASYDQAIALRPDFAQAHSNRGVALQEFGQMDAAIASYRRALAADPGHAEAHSNLGNALQELRQYDAAIASYDRAVGIRSDYADAYINRGKALLRRRKLDAALASFDKALIIRPEDADALANRGNTLKELKLFESAAACYERAMTADPGHPFIFGTTLLIRMRLCDWAHHAENVASLETRIGRGEKATHPFVLLAVCDSPDLHRLAAETYMQATYPPDTSLGTIAPRGRRKRIRVGYYSADFRRHAVSYLIAELFETHDREKIECVAFSFGPDAQDTMRERIRAACDDFIDVDALSDREVARLSREREIDIAVDLGGLTADSRTGIFACRAAPLQVNYLGYGGTMGAAYYDYLIADRSVVPEGAERHYIEKIVRLPCYQVNDSTRPIADRPFTRQELGLPEAGFVFCCFNNHYKITPATFDGWMRLLQRVESSVLWLLVDNAAAARNLRKEAERRGVDAGRLVFAGRMPLAEHLARHRLADLYLDTLPCNGGASASDALWAGLPVLTAMGATFVGRVAASLLGAVGLPELVTHSQREYEARAEDLARDPARLAGIRASLQRNRASAALFDAAQFTRNLEPAYAAMHERRLACLPPAHLTVAGSPGTATFCGDS